MARFLLKQAVANCFLDQLNGLTREDENQRDRPPEPGTPEKIYKREYPDKRYVHRCSSEKKTPHTEISQRKFLYECTPSPHKHLLNSYCVISLVKKWGYKISQISSLLPRCPCGGRNRQRDQDHTKGQRL